MATIKYNEDCHYFFSSVCTKPDCKYRHSDIARHTTVVCKYWLNDRCTRGINCPFRHSHNGLVTVKPEMSPQLVTFAPVMSIAPMQSYIAPKMCKFEHRLPNGCMNDSCVYVHSMPKRVPNTAITYTQIMDQSLVAKVDPPQSSAEKAIICKVCYDTREEIDANDDNQLMVTSCGHLICRLCMQQIMASYKMCPICRQVIQSQQIIYL